MTLFGLFIHLFIIALLSWLSLTKLKGFNLSDVGSFFFTFPDRRISNQNHLELLILKNYDYSV